VLSALPCTLIGVSRSSLCLARQSGRRASTTPVRCQIGRYPTVRPPRRRCFPGVGGRRAGFLLFLCYLLVHTGSLWCALCAFRVCV